MFILTAFRGGVLAVTWKFSIGLEQKSWWIFRSFLVGWRFDTVVACYILTFPIFIFGISHFIFKDKKRWILRGGHLLAQLSFVVAFLAAAFDISYFETFNTRLNANILNWVNNGAIALGMIASQWHYVLVFALSLWAFFRFTNKVLRVYIFQKMDTLIPEKPAFVFQFVGIVFLLFIGMRGSLTKSPTRVASAYFSPFPYPNQLALNPLFNFYKTYQNRLEFNEFTNVAGNEKVVLDSVRYWLGAPEKTIGGSPIARRMRFDAPPQYNNVVLVLMESLSANFMTHFGDSIPEKNIFLKGLTPTIDSLAANGIFFENFYSSGIHTNNGIYSSLTGYPVVPMRHPLKREGCEAYESLPEILRKNDYTTSFFATHDKDFDNMANFLAENGIREYYHETDYPKEDIIGTWGVPDHNLFKFALNKMGLMAARKKPFFTTLLTVSHHPPYTLPDSMPIAFKAHTPQYQSVEYADWAIKQFMAEAKKQPWFSNTIFVFVGDHGKTIGTQNRYDMAISYNHIPLIIYAEGLSPRVVKGFGGQIDISETILGLLRLPHVNNGFGQDLLRTTRKRICFQDDFRVAAIDDERFYINRLAAYQLLYDYKNQRLSNLVYKEKARANQMHFYTLAMAQAAEWMIIHNKTKLKNEN